MLVIGFSMKDSMDSYLSKMMKSQAGNEVSISGSALVDSLHELYQEWIKSSDNLS
ncbi:MAG: hypothetical protein MZV64_20680 [Ignavibacteriales bacterium]|nr:hypothetical protein [Ignavibacteriales bacterium]